MLAFFRTLSKSRTAWIILGIPLVASLLLIGNVRTNLLQGLFSGDAVVVAGSRQMSSADFKREFDNYRERLQQQQGQPVTPEELVAGGVDKQMLQAFAKRESTTEQLRRDGIVPSDNQLVDAIKATPAFLDQTGHFDPRVYEQVLNKNKLTPDIYHESLRGETATNHLAAAAAYGLKPPRLIAAALATYQFEQHNVSYFMLNPKLMGPPPTPTDAQLTAIMDANKAKLTTGETRIFTVVRFSAKALAATVTADPAEVKKRYDFRKDTQSTPEKRTLVQVPAKSAADAQAIAVKLAQGQSPAVVAKAEGVDVVSYTDQPKGAIADPKVADAAFGLAEGKSSGPIQGNLGFAVIKVLKITPGHQVTLDEARPKIEEEVKAEAAANKAYEESQKYQDAHDKGANLMDSAKAAGVTPVSLAAVTAEGRDDMGKPTGLSPKLLKEGFALSQGAESDVVQEDKGEYLVVRADKIIAPQPPTLEKYRKELTQFFQGQDTARRMSVRLAALAEQVKKGQSLDAVAASVGSKVSHISLTRAQAEQNQQTPPEQLQRIFQAGAGDVFSTGGAVAKIDSIVPPVGPGAGTAVNGAQQQIARQIFDELIVESGALAQKTLKTKTNATLALQAIGVQPDAASGTAPAAAKPGLPAPAGRAR